MVPLCGGASALRGGQRTFVLSQEHQQNLLTSLYPDTEGTTSPAGSSEADKADTHRELTIAAARDGPHHRAKQLLQHCSFSVLSQNQKGNSSPNLLPDGAIDEVGHLVSCEVGRPGDTPSSPTPLSSAPTPGSAPTPPVFASPLALFLPVLAPTPVIAKLPARDSVFATPSSPTQSAPSPVIAPPPPTTGAKLLISFTFRRTDNSPWAKAMGKVHEAGAHTLE